MEIKTHHILLVSMMVFIVLNLIENYLHYTIGFSAKENKFTLPKPSKEDWSKIILVMIIFAYLQGWFTEFFSQYY